MEGKIRRRVEEWIGRKKENIEFFLDGVVDLMEWIISN